MAEVYFFDASKSYDETENDVLVNQTFQQAQIAAAVQNYRGTELVVLRFEISDEFVGDDFSCENASESSIVDVDDMEHAELTGVYVDTNYNPSLRLFYISNLMMSNEYLNLEGFSELEIQAAKMINDADCYMEELFCHEWDTELEQVVA